MKLKRLYSGIVSITQPNSWNGGYVVKLMKELLLLTQKAGEEHPDYFEDITEENASLFRFDAAKGYQLFVMPELQQGDEHSYTLKRMTSTPHGDVPVDSFFCYLSAHVKNVSISIFNQPDFAIEFQYLPDEMVKVTVYRLL